MSREHVPAVTLQQCRTVPTTAVRALVRRYPGGNSEYTVRPDRLAQLVETLDAYVGTLNGRGAGLAFFHQRLAQVGVVVTPVS